MDEVWRLTQTPLLHERWDLRFSTIRYLPKAEGETQRFLYTTRIGFGVAIEGEGETAGTMDSTTTRTSALRFWSDSSLSLIRAGSGYWKYEEQGTSTRFFTWYDYQVRFGRLGKLLDWMCFRPLIGWATAWSFDRLRLWAERGVGPEQVRRATLIYAATRLGCTGVWLWHGVVPKLLLRDGDELRMMAAHGLPASFVLVAGWAEVVLALVGLLTWRWRGYFVLTAVLMVLALGDVTFVAPEYLGRAFTPVTLNGSVAALCVAGFLAWPETAFAGRCRRQPKKPGSAR